jgi:hypothetical protein
MHLLSAFRSQRRQLVLGNAPAATDQALARSRLQGTNVLEARFVASLRIADITGQSLPILVSLPTIDVLWSDLHMVHEDRSLMSYDSFYWTFRTARTQKILAGNGDPSS